MTRATPHRNPAPSVAEERELTPVAQRALAEADERRKERNKQPLDTTKEVGGRNGPDPTRFGDWEKNGIVSDF